MRSPTLRRLAAGLIAPAIGALGLGACGSDSGVSRADMEQYLQEGGFSEDQASCVTDQLFEALDEDQLLAVYEAESDDDLEPAIGDAVESASTACAGDG